MTTTGSETKLSLVLYKKDFVFSIKTILPDLKRYTAANIRLLTYVRAVFQSRIERPWTNMTARSPEALPEGFTGEELTQHM